MKIFTKLVKFFTNRVKFSSIFTRRFFLNTYHSNKIAPRS